MVFIALGLAVLVATVVAAGTVAASAARVRGWLEAGVWAAYVVAAAAALLAALTGFGSRSLLPAALVVVAAVLLSLEWPLPGCAVALVALVLPPQVAVGLFRYLAFALLVLAGAAALRLRDAPDDEEEEPA